MRPMYNIYKNHKPMTISQLPGLLLLWLITACGLHKCFTWRVIYLNVFLQPVTDAQHIFSYTLQPLHTFIYNLSNLPGKSISINWQYAAPVHSSSILVKFDAKQSLTHANISCRLRLSVVTFVE